VPTSYDPLISKLIAWAPDRAGAIARMLRALDEYDLRGIRTTIGFCRWLISQEDFKTGNFDTTTVDRILERHAAFSEKPDEQLEEMVAIAAALQAYTGMNRSAESRALVPAQESLWARQARLDSLR